jgi:hypothetical protein
LEVVSCIIRLSLGDLQLLLQGGHLLLYLAGHSLLHTFDFLRSFDLGLPASLSSRDSFRVVVGRIPHYACPSLSSQGKLLQQKKIGLGLRPHKMTGINDKG